MPKPNQPKVSIVTVAYNQQTYIAQALEGFVSQKTNFEFEVIVADDCSTDDTPAIIKRYARDYPHIVKPLLRTKNVGAVKNFVATLQTVTGDYVALCEGDDYWTNSNKLQLQADFLDAHPSYALCFHPVKVFFESHEQPDYIFPTTEEAHDLSIEALLTRNFIQTNSVMYRRQDYAALPDDILPLDWYLHLYHAQFGKIGFIDEVMADYRRHSGGIWWGAYSDKYKIWKKYGLAHIRLYMEVMKLYGNRPRRAQIINNSVIALFDELAAVDKKHGEKLLAQAIDEFPVMAETYFGDLLKRVTNLDEHSHKQAEIIAHVGREQEELQRINHDLNKNLSDLSAENSRLKSKKLVRLESAMKRRIRQITKK